MKTVLDAIQIKRLLDDLADRVLADLPGGSHLAVIGVRSRGAELAQRLTTLLTRKSKQDIPCGVLDITLYRDDLNDPHGSVQPQVRTTEITFDIDEKLILLVDDVLFTGRSTRAALDALIDLGRPQAIRLAVLVDRLGRELPIQADYACTKVDVAPTERVQVHLIESDGKDEVIVE